MNSFFKNPQAQKEIEDLYQEKLEALPISHQFLTIETSFGNTNIIRTGQEGKPPLVLLHGANGCAPIAIESLIGLVKHFTIYAIDIVGQPNKSAATRPAMTGGSYGKWMSEILTKLNVSNAVLVGISFGGFITLKTLVFDTKRISAAFLIVPAGMVNGNPLLALWKVFLPMKLYKWQKNVKYVHQFLTELFTEQDSFAVQYLSKVFLHFEMDFSPIPLIKKIEAQRIKTPIHVIAAEKDILFPGEKLLKRAKDIFPSLGKVLLLKNSKHVPNRSANELIEDLIKEYGKHP